MSSKHIRGDVNYAWPSAQIAVMGAEVWKMESTFVLYREYTLDCTILHHNIAMTMMSYEYLVVDG